MKTLEPRPLRALTLIVLCLLGLAAVVAGYLRPDLVGRPRPAAVPSGSAARQPDLASDMDWISYREGWLVAVDRQSGTSTLFHTADAGRHWTRERVSTAWESVDFFDPQNGILYSSGAVGQSLQPGTAVTTYRTGDGGRHWQKVGLPKGARAQPPSFVDARHGWVWNPSPVGLYATSDGGGHWRRLEASGIPRVGPTIRTVGFRDGSHGWAAAPTGSSAPTLYATSDGGASWTGLPVPAPGDGWPAGSQFEVGPTVISSDGRGQLIISEFVPWGYGLVMSSHWVAATTDAGATWSVPRRIPDAQPGTIVHITTSRVDGSASWAWSADGLLATRDGGGHWTSIAIPQRWSINRLQAIDAETVWAAASVTDGNGNSHWSLFSTRDGGGTWTEARPPSMT